MNDDEFEDKLRALSGKLVRPDPTAAWKADILACARQTREKVVPRTPRVLLTVLAAAWLLIAVLRLTTPADTATPGGPPDSASLAMRDDSPLRALMAFQSRRELLDLP
jgi:hypothetical protein